MENKTNTAVWFLATDVDCKVCPARKYVPCTYHDGRAKSPCVGRSERAEKAARRRGREGGARVTTFERNTFARDLRAYLAISDARKAENAAARARAKGNAKLVALMEENSRRRGQGGAIDWAEYFRNAGIA